MLKAIMEDEERVIVEEEGNKSGSSQTAVVRSRWSPKPEQILILESIFNSGMVNPPKEETVRIRRVLEKFGAVGDANVFYWFQNRRSRSRRRQKQQQQQQQQQLLQQQQQQQHTTFGANININHIDHDLQLLQTMSYNINNNIGTATANHHPIPSPPFPPDMPFFQSPGMMTVFINGIATEVPKGGPIEVKPMFGEDVVLVHSSGVALPTNEFGILLNTLHPGESYFLVPRPTYNT